MGRKLLLVFLILVCIAFTASFGCGDDDDDDDNNDDNDTGDDDSGDDDSGDDDTGDDDTGDDDTGDDDTGDDDTGDDDTGDDDTGDDDDDDDISFTCDHNQNYANEGAKIHLIDIADGEVVYINTENGYSILMNGGPDDPTNRVINYLLDEGVTSLDELVMASILDEDTGEIPDILDTFSVDLVRKTPAVSSSASYLAAMQKISDLSIQVVENKAGDTLDWLGAPEKVLGPIYPFPDDYTDRDKSMVVKFGMGRVDVMLASAMTATAEYDIVDLYREIVCSEALLVSYHGSNDATDETFLDGVDPSQAIIVAGWANPDGFPHIETRTKLDERWIEYGVTGTQGNMVWQSDGWDIWFCEG